MNILNRSHKERGVGLIEILIVLVVLVIGWAAIAALQGKLMTGSSVTKARNIAQELAREKTEELRTSIEKGQFSSAFEEDPTITDEAIINAEFTRSWTVEDVTLATGAVVDHLKQLEVTVTWKNNENIDEKVVLNTMIAFADPITSTFLEPGESGPGGFAPINSQTGREGPGTVVPGYVLDPDAGDGNDDTLDDNIYTGVDDEGNPVVFQGIPVAGGFENGFTAYGGKIIKFSGTIYYDYDGDHPFVQASSPSFCSAYYGTSGECLTGDSNIICAKYACYAGGDCSNGGVGCPDDVADLPKLNGGWYGKIGDFFPGINPLKFPTICMSDPLNHTEMMARAFLSVSLRVYL